MYLIQQEQVRFPLLLCDFRIQLAARGSPAKNCELEWAPYHLVRALLPPRIGHCASNHLSRDLYYSVEINVTCAVFELFMDTRQVPPGDTSVFE